jgi:hypothetical protein
MSFLHISKRRYVDLAIWTSEPALWKRTKFSKMYCCKEPFLPLAALVAEGKGSEVQQLCLSEHNRVQQF